MDLTFWHKDYVTLFGFACLVIGYLFGRVLPQDVDALVKRKGMG